MHIFVSKNNLSSINHSYIDLGLFSYTLLHAIPISMPAKCIGQAFSHHWDRINGYFPKVSQTVQDLNRACVPQFSILTLCVYLLYLHLASLS